jgi:hypothetical protein
MRALKASPAHKELFMRPITTLLAAALTLAATAASAADTVAAIGAVKGDVLVATGGKLAPAAKGAVLKSGDRVIARSGGAALTYADGCSVSVPANGMAVVAAKSPCAGGPGLVTASQGSAAALPKMGLPDWPTGAYFAGAGVAVIGGAIIYGLTKKDETPVSN